MQFKESLKSYLNSFKVKKRFWFTFLADSTFFFLFTLVFAAFGAYMQRKSFSLTGGMSPAEVQQLMLASPEKAAVFLSDIKSFLVVIIIGIVVLVTLALFSYSLSQAWIWNYLHHKKLTKQTYWKWNTLNLALIFPLLIFGLGFLIVKLLFSWLLTLLLTINMKFYYAHSNLMEIIQTILNGVVSFFMILLVMVFLFLAYHCFVQRYKVWSSIGAAFELYKHKWKRIWKVMFWALLTGIILNLIMYPLKNSLQFHPLILLLLQLVVGLLFISWFRLYLLRTIADEH